MATLNLKTLANGDFDYVDKHNKNYSDIASLANQQDTDISALKAAISTQGQIDFRVNMLNQIDNGSFEVNQRNPGNATISVNSGTLNKTFVIDRWYSSGTQGPFEVTPTSGTSTDPAFLTLSGTGQIYQDMRDEFILSIDPLGSNTAILMSCDINTLSGSARIGFFDGNFEIFSFDVATAGIFNRVTLNGIVLGGPPLNARAIIQVSGTTAQVRRYMCAFGNLNDLPYTATPEAHNWERCRRYYESGTWSALGVGFSGTTERQIGSEIRYDSRKIEAPTVDISFSGTLPGSGGTISTSQETLDGFLVTATDGDASSGIDGFQVIGAEWTADTDQ